MAFALSNAANFTNIDNLIDVVICAFFASQLNSPQLVHEDLQQIHPDDMEKMDLRWKMTMLTMRARRAPRNQDNKNKDKAQRVVCLWRISNFYMLLVSCVRLGGLTRVIRQRRGLNLHSWLFIFNSDSEGEITIRELRNKLEIVQKEKDDIQLNVDKFEHASKSLNKLIKCQIIDNCKKGLGYENYNAVPPPYIENFMPPTPDLSFTSLDEFVNEPVVENYKVMSSEEEPKVVRKNNDAPIIEE
ncbi:hypothetical protein Tco_1105825 [Tanacetum coccineum]